MPKMARTCRPTGDWASNTPPPRHHDPLPPHAPLWCALEFHAFICKDYEMRPVAAKVLYALPAAGAAFSFLSGCVRGFPSRLSPSAAFWPFFALFACPSVRFADLLCMQKSVANTQTLATTTHRSPTQPNRRQSSADGSDMQNIFA